MLICYSITYIFLFVLCINWTVDMSACDSWNFLHSLNSFLIRFFFQFCFSLIFFSVTAFVGDHWTTCIFNFYYLRCLYWSYDFFACLFRHSLSTDSFLSGIKVQFFTILWFSWFLVNLLSGTSLALIMLWSSVLEIKAPYVTVKYS